jgi:S1-C subfamily serine protease
VIPQLEQTGRVERAYLGIQGATAPDGVLVESVEEGSPAQAAGVRPGDTLERLAGKPVRTMEDVSHILASHAPGDVVEIEIRTGGITHGAKATLADRPAAMPSA